MKKLFLSSMVMILFSTSLLVFDLSCRKEVIAKSPAANTGIVLFRKNNATTSELWRMNYDGSGLTEIKIVPPASNLNMDFDAVRLSQDGLRLFFSCYDLSTFEYFVYSCDLDGTTNMKKIYQTTPGGGVGLADVH